MDLRIEDIYYRYPAGVLALNGVSLQVKAGETLAIVGENGAGKSTLAKHINGLLKPSQGRLLVGDWDTKEYSPAKLARRVGLAFQNPDDQLFGRTVKQEVEFGPRNLRFDEERITHQTEMMLEWVGLLDAADTHPYDLPLSQRKLVVIAAILSMDTEIVILDEPTIGQDRRGVDCLGSIIERLNGKGCTVIVISHDMDFCAEYCKRVVVMANGHVVADGPAQQVLYMEQLLRSAALEPPQIVRLALALKLDEAAPLTVPAFTRILQKRMRE